MTGAGDPVLRRELRFRRRATGDTVLIEDPMTGGYFETDRETSSFVRLLDGRRSPEAALARLRRDLPDARLTEEDAPRLLDELDRQGLLEKRAAGPPERAPARRLDAVSQRLRLGAYDAAFACCARRLGGMQSWATLPFWLLLLAAALGALAGSWDRFAFEIGRLIAVDSVIWLWLAWLLSEAWHEFQHGLTARRYGVAVREVGLLFVIFLPLGAYVDVTGVWRVDNRWKRLHITLAGILGELALGAAALLLWTQTPTGELSAFLQSLVVATTVSTLLFNASPLMRFDGYHALVDLFDAPNLYQRSASAIRAQAVRAISGARTTTPEPRGVMIYGWLSFAWRMRVMVTLTVLAAHLAFGFGVALGALVIWRMAIVPLGRLVALIWRLEPGARRVAAFRLAAALGAGAMLWFAPAPVFLRAPGLVELRDAVQLRATSPGEVVRLFVADGQRVAEGDPIMTLENPQIRSQARNLSAERAKLEIQLAVAQSDGALAAASDFRRRIVTLDSEIEELETRIAGLSITAPSAGVFFRRDFDSLLGAWINRGDLIAEFADPKRLDARVWLTPEDARRLRREPDGLRLLSDGAPPPGVPVRLSRIEPSATTDLPPAAITAEGGGPLLVLADQEERRLAETCVEATFTPAATTPGWPGAPGTLSAPTRWRRFGGIALEWIGEVDLLGPASWNFSSR